MCFRAKNSLSNHERYSPEQAVLGRASKLPASVVSDEDSPSHLLASSDQEEGIACRAALRRRTAARESFLQCENSSAWRRALLRQSRGEIINWHTGQLCMYWSKRQSPNITEIFCPLNCGAAQLRLYIASTKCKQRTNERDGCCKNNMQNTIQPDAHSTREASLHKNAVIIHHPQKLQSHPGD